MDILNRLGLTPNVVKISYKDSYLAKESSIILENHFIKDCINETLSTSQESNSPIKKDRNILQKMWDKFIEFINKIIKFIKRVALKVRLIFYKNRVEKIDHVLAKKKKPKYVTKIYSEKKMSNTDLLELVKKMYYGEHLLEEQQPKMKFGAIMYNTPIGAETHYLRSFVSALEETLQNGSHRVYKDKLFKKEELEALSKLQIFDSMDRIHKIFPDFTKSITDNKLKSEKVTDENIKAFNSNITTLFIEVAETIRKNDKNSIHHVYQRYLNVLEKIKTEKVNDVTPEYIDYLTKLVKDVQVRVQWVNDDIDKFLSVIEDIYGLKNKRQ